MDIDNRIPQSVQELEQMAEVLRSEMCAPLQGRIISTGVILHALLTMYRQAARTLPASAQCEIGYALAGLAGDLIANPASARPTHEVHQFLSETPSKLQ